MKAEDEKKPKAAAPAVPEEKKEPPAEKLFECPNPGCGRKFASEHELQLHVDRRHHKSPAEGGDKPLAQKIDYEKLFLEDGMCETVDEVEEVVLTHRELKVFEPHKQIETEVLARITTLSLSHNQIQDIEFLQFFSSLRELNINNNLVENLWYPVASSGVGLWRT